MKLGRLSFLSWILVIIVFILLASYLLSMFLGLSLFFSTTAGLDFSVTPVNPAIFILFFFGFTFPFELNAAQLFFFLWCVFLLCFVVSWRLRKSFHKVVGEFSKQPLIKIFDNWLFLMPIIASELLVGVLVIIGLQNLFNVQTGTLPTPQSDMELFNLYLNISYAPVIEELGFRIIPIGAFVLVYFFLFRLFSKKISLSSWQRFKLLVFSFLYPDGAKSIVQEKTVAVYGLKGIQKGEWVVILVTSLLFGAAHILTGIGWEIGKVTSTFVQGFVFAIVYVAYGFQAPILMHWFFNYYFYTYEVTAQYYPTTLEMFIWIELITLTLGAIGLIISLLSLIKKFLNKRRKVPQEPIVFPL